MFQFRQELIRVLGRPVRSLRRGSNILSGTHYTYDVNQEVSCVSIWPLMFQILKRRQQQRLGRNGTELSTVAVRGFRLNGLLSLYL
jgi:hypothetical protein